MINGKLEEPFIHFANGQNDLIWLSPIDRQKEFITKFYEEIHFEKIENFGVNKKNISKSSSRYCK